MSPACGAVVGGAYDTNVRSSLAALKNTNHKGNLAEAAVVFHAARLGIPVSRPLFEHGRYDLVLDVGSRLLRVQCKWASRKGAVVQVQIAGSHLTPGGYVRRRYFGTEIDAIAAYCGELDRCYLLPMELVADKWTIQLRISPPKNGQRAGLNWATDYEFPGAVAQLVERRHGMAEATGSSPVSSTSKGGPRTELIIGAHEFRDHFGYYMELAEKGTEVRVTRHGRLYVRLLSSSCLPEPQA